MKWSGVRSFSVIALCLAGHVAAAGSAPENCRLTEEDKRHNASLSYDAFDQEGIENPDQDGPNAATWRRLSMRGCTSEALEAAEDYLMHAEFKNSGQQHNVMFHIAQTLGQMNRYEAAALMTASARKVGTTADDALDWNTYLEGTWAFFKRDRTLLKEAENRLSAEPGTGNRINGGVLAGLLQCFEKPYSEAYGNECRPKIRD